MPSLARVRPSFSLKERASGVLLHPTSLPGPHGNGDLGASARAFVDFLASASQRWWQMLPVGPTGYGNSPYSAESAFAGNPLLISLEGLVDDGLLARSELGGAAHLPRDHVDYGAATVFREGRLREAFASFEKRSGADGRAFDAFCKVNKGWLDDYALFKALKRAQGDVEWTRWEPELRDRDANALAHARTIFAAEIRFRAFEQFVFSIQWKALREYAASKGIGLIGDVPIFVAHDSADVWQHPEMFRLDARGMPTVISGVPPDYFSATGQRWGNPLYRWAKMKKNGYAWWVARLRQTFARFDAVRIDHFIGFQRYWEIDAHEATAQNGRWMKGPGADFFEKVKSALGDLPFIAEDLGAVTPAVKALRDRFELPGIRVLQFAFGDDPSAPDFLPHNYPARCVVYTGTHDNDTTRGWYDESGGQGSTRSPAQTDKERAAARRYLASDGRHIHWDMIRMAMLSVANLALFPLQDVLGLGSDARMNRPGTSGDNWAFRVADGALAPEIAAKLGGLTHTYGRAPTPLSSIEGGAR